jgi:apurinic endonuclease APN1
MVFVGFECELSNNINPLYNCIHLILKSNANAFQFYLGDHNNTSIKQKFIFNNLSIHNFLKIVNKYKLISVIHASLSVNIVSPVYSKRFLWNFQNVIFDLNQSVIIKSFGVVIHLGSKNTKNFNFDNKTAILNAINGIKYILSNSDPLSTLILETPAQSGSKIAFDIKDLAKIFKPIYKIFKNRVGICIDTQHIFTSGYNISTIDGVIDFFTYFHKLIGINNIKLFHINDSAVPFHSKVDRHQFIGKGYIFKNNFDPLAIICNIARINNIPMILETHNSYNYKFEVSTLTKLSLKSSLPNINFNFLYGGSSIKNCNINTIISKSDKLLCIKLFQKLKDIHIALGNIHQANTYSRILRIFKFYPDINTIGDIINLNLKIGKKTIDKICEIISTKHIYILDKMLNDKKLNSIIKLQDILGIGPKFAIKLVNKGIDSVDKLKKSNIKLSILQNLGLKYYNKIDNQLESSDIDKFIDYIYNLPFLKNKIIIYPAGSYRTGKNILKDIDLIVITNLDFNYIVDNLVNNNILLDYYINSPNEFIGFFKSLTDNKKVYHVDFRIIDKQFLPFYLLFFGSGVDFSTDIRHIAKTKGYKLNQFGIFDSKTNKKIMNKFKNENDIFKFLGLKYIKPHDRIKNYKFIDLDQ